MSWISDQDIDAYHELRSFATPVAVPGSASRPTC